MSQLGKRSVHPTLADPPKMLAPGYAETSSNVSKSARNILFNYFVKVSTYKCPENANLEVELRLGRSTGSAFNSGVTESFFNEYMGKLTGSGDFNLNLSDDMDYSYQENSKFDRLTVTQSGLHETMKKIRTHHPETLATRFTFDCRISAAKEIPVPDAPDIIPDGWETKRKKERTEFDNPNCLWVIHLTKVTSMKRGDDVHATTSFEIEYELKQSRELISSDIQVLAVNELWDLLLAQFGGVEDRLELFLDDVPAKDVAQLSSYCWTIVDPIERSRSGFPGSMPVSFSRRHLLTVQTKEYFVSEKTDGIRYMMLIRRHAAFMIGRKFDFHLLCEFPELGTLAYHGDTLLDGELVETLDPSSLTFMLFDVLQFDGKNLTSRPLTERLHHIGHVVKWYRNHLPKIRSTKAPFSLIGKTFQHKNSFNKVRPLITKVGHDRVYNDGGKRKHRTDGFILTPNGPYHPKGTPNLFKWKYSDLLSIDFRLLSRRGELVLACGGDAGRELVCRKLDLSEEDYAKVEAILQSRHRIEDDAYYAWLSEEPVILELTYDASSGVWKFHKERTDKTSPNHISVVFDTMESISENITEDEIYARIPKSPGDDDWPYRRM